MKLVESSLILKQKVITISTFINSNKFCTSSSKVQMPLLAIPCSCGVQLSSFFYCWQSMGTDIRDQIAFLPQSQDYSRYSFRFQLSLLRFCLLGAEPRKSCFQLNNHSQHWLQQHLQAHDPQPTSAANVVEFSKIFQFPTISNNWQAEKSTIKSTSAAR